MAATQPVDIGESDTGNGQEHGTEEEQREPEGIGEEAPVQQEQTSIDEPEQQPPQPETNRETGTEQQTEEAPLDNWMKNEAVRWVRIARHFPTGVPCVGRSRAEGQGGKEN